MSVPQRQNYTMNPDDLPWEPWNLHIKGAPPNDAIPNAPEWDGEFGGWIKVLSTPENGDGWTFLIRHVPPPGKGILYSGISRSREQSYCLAGARLTDDGQRISLVGDYNFKQAEIVHGGTAREEMVHFVHFDGDPDEVSLYEVVD